MSQTQIARSIIIPAYSEASCIVSSLQTIHDYLQQQKWLDSIEVIVVTADAHDNTPAIVAREITIFPLHQHITPGPRVGKGRDVKAGMKAARGGVMVFTDADLATPIHHMAKAFEILEEQGGMVMGVRNLKHVHNSLKRRLSSLVSNALVRTIIGWDVSDSQCGFKGFTREVADVILARSQVVNWGFDFEFIKIAKVQHIPVATMLIADWHDPKQASENLTGDSQFSAMVSTLRELIMVCKNTLRGRYK